MATNTVPDEHPEIALTRRDGLKLAALGIASVATLMAAVSVLPMSAAMIPSARLSPLLVARRGMRAPWTVGLVWSPPAWSCWPSSTPAVRTG